MESEVTHKNILLFEKCIVNDRNQGGIVLIVLEELSDKKL